MTAEQEYKRKFMIAVGALVVAVGVSAGTWVWSVTRAAKSDQDSLAAQRRFNGMPDRAAVQRQMLDRLAQELRLTEAQKTSVGKLQEEMRAEMERNRPRRDADREKSRERMEAMRRNHDAQMAEILTPQQLEKFKTIQQERRRAMGRGGPGMGGPGMGGPPMMGGPGDGMPPGGMPTGGDNGPPGGGTPPGMMPSNGGPQGGMFPGGGPPGDMPPRGGNG